MRLCQVEQLDGKLLSAEHRLQAANIELRASQAQVQSLTESTQEELKRAGQELDLVSRRWFFRPARRSCLDGPPPSSLSDRLFCFCPARSSVQHREMLRAVKRERKSLQDDVVSQFAVPSRSLALPRRW